MRPEYVDGWPNLSGDEAEVMAARRGCESAFKPDSDIDFGRVRAAWGIALHMQQPLIPAGGGDLRSAEIISNLKHMMDNPGIGDNHNAHVFHWCYKRIGEFVPELVDQGKSPRVMLDYSGCLFHGLRQMGLDDVVDTLRRVTVEPRYRRCVEWLGCPWGHAVAPSTPVQDYARHVSAWRHHFAAIFGLEAAARVRGFSPAEMALPNHPDVAYAFVKTLRDEGYLWVLVQEHTIEEEDGNGLRQPHVPHRLVARNSRGEEISILCLTKTQGSDTKLVAQMQPCFEARSLGTREVAGRRIPPFVAQIGDGENGGVMMNEFPQPFKQTMAESSGTETPAMNGTEYLEHLFAQGFREEDFPVVRPKWTKLLFDNLGTPNGDAQALAKAIEDAKRSNHQFNMEGGSWTNNISWVQGYENLLGPMDKVSALFQERAAGAAPDDPRYRKALFHLLCTQISCYRYWGQGIWTDYGREICRRLEDILNYDFAKPEPARAAPPAAAASALGAARTGEFRSVAAAKAPESGARGARGALRKLLESWKKPLIAFSGGVDSALLARVAKEECPGADLAILTGAFLSADSLARARELARSIGLPLREIPWPALESAAIVRNDAERCYHCKKAGFGLLRDYAKREGHDALLDGQNASDDASDRPGTRAAAELDVYSPLRESGLGKDDLRAWAKELGLSNWNLPSDACLATRITTGQPLDAGVLRKVEAAEAEFARLGFARVRVRAVTDGGRLGARIEVAAEDLDRLCAPAMREAAKAAAERAGFAWTAADLRGYRPAGAKI